MGCASASAPHTALQPFSAHPNGTFPSPSTLVVFSKNLQFFLEAQFARRSHNHLETMLSDISSHYYVFFFLFQQVLHYQKASPGLVCTRQPTLRRLKSNVCKESPLHSFGYSLFILHFEPLINKKHSKGNSMLLFTTAMKIRMSLLRKSCMV